MQYVIEYFDDFAPHHRIVKKLKKSEVSEWVNEYGQLKYIPRSTKNFNALYKVGGERVRAEDFGNGSGFDTLSTRHDGEDAKIRRVGTEQGGERHSKGDDSGNGKSVNDNRQGRNGSSVSSGTEQKFSTVGRYDNLSEERLREIKMNWPLTWAFHNDILKSEDMIIINNEARNVFVDKTECDRYRVRRNVYAFPVTNGKTVFMSGSFANPVIDFVVEDIGTEHDILVNSLRRYASYARKNGNDKGTVPIIRRFFGTRGIVSHDRNDFSYDRWETVARSGANGSGISEENRSRESEVTSEKQKFSTVNSTQLALENPDVYDEIQVTYDEILQKTKGKDPEAALLEEAQKHREDLQMWEHEADALVKLRKNSERDTA